MDHPLSSSPQREDAAPQIDEVEKIASQMAWEDEADIGVQSGDDEADFQSGKDKGPQIGEGAWVGGVWHNLIDPHPFAPRESLSRLEFDRIMNRIQVR
jgi:hypothetical protein